MHQVPSLNVFFFLFHSKCGWMYACQEPSCGMAHTHKKYRSYQSIVFQLLHLDEIRGVGDVCSATLVKIWGGGSRCFFSLPPNQKKIVSNFFFFFIRKKKYGMSVCVSIKKKRGVRGGRHVRLPSGGSIPDNSPLPYHRTKKK